MGNARQNPIQKTAHLSVVMTAQYNTEERFL